MSLGQATPLTTNHYWLGSLQMRLMCVKFPTLSALMPFFGFVLHPVGGPGSHNFYPWATCSEVRRQIVKGVDGVQCVFIFSFSGVWWVGEKSARRKCIMGGAPCEGQ